MYDQTIFQITVWFSDITIFFSPQPKDIWVYYHVTQKQHIHTDPEQSLNFGIKNKV